MGNAAYKAGNYAVALKELLPEAAKGNADAQAKVGVIYLEGRGTARNYAQAGKWLTAAARAGNPEAQRNLAQMYRLGLGLPTDDGKALNYFEVADFDFALTPASIVEAARTLTASSTKSDS